MLVLSRKSSERILIGENISIEVRRIAGNRVTLAVDAPRDIRILRGELEVAATDFEQPTDAEKPAEAPQPAAEAGQTTYHVSHHRVPLAPLSTEPAPTAAVG